MFNNKNILITGGTGSFGSAFLDVLLKDTNASKILIFSRDEEKQDQMRNKLNNNKRVQFIIGDIRDRESIKEALTGIDFVFHAAALKQVPSCEFFPKQAFLTNVMGSSNLIQASIESKVKRLVLLSTDKAVYPINAMGLSKAMMEKVAIASSRQASDTLISLTRYGNVLASRGSVIPKFIQQIKNHEFITVTDPHMTRFFMTLEESVKLVLHALNYSKRGEIYVQKSAAFSIENLVKALYIIFDKKPKIKIIGTRNGEKLYETLISSEEMLRVNDEGNYYCIQPEVLDLNYSKFFDTGKSTAGISTYSSHNTKNLSIEEIVPFLLKLPIIQSVIS